MIYVLRHTIVHVASDWLMLYRLMDTSDMILQYCRNQRMGKSITNICHSVSS